MAAWCRRWLGAEPVEVVFRAGYLSEVTGLWPAPDDRDGDLDAHPGPVWLERLAEEVAERAAPAGVA